MSVRIIPNKNSGKVVTPFQSNPDFGFIQFESSQMMMNGGWLREVKRNATMKGPVDVLEKFIANNKGLTVKGHIVVQEFTEDNIPAGIRATYLNRGQEDIENYYKRPNADGDVMTSNGVAILRFQIYDETGTMNDILVDHDRVQVGVGANTGANNASL